jgi:hypothetical protein
MISDKIGIQLHDKATKGEPLTDKEKAQLVAWYAQQDSTESYPVQTADNAVGALRLQIESALSQLMKITQRIQQVAAENEAIRLENQSIKLQLAQSLGRQTA